MYRSSRRCLLFERCRPCWPPSRLTGGHLRCSGWDVSGHDRQISVSHISLCGYGEGNPAGRSREGAFTQLKHSAIELLCCGEKRPNTPVYPPVNHLHKPSSTHRQSARNYSSLHSTASCAPWAHEEPGKTRAKKALSLRSQDLRFRRLEEERFHV